MPRPMATAETSAAGFATHRTARPAILRLLERETVNPLWIGLVTASILMAAYVGLEGALGRLTVVFAADAEAETFQDFRLTFVMLALLAYIPAAQLAAARSVRRGMEELRPVLGFTASEFNRLRDAVGTCEFRRFWQTRIVALVVAVAGMAAMDRFLEEASVWSMSVEARLHRILIPLLIVFSSGLAQSLFVESRRFAELGRRPLAVGLLDLGRLAPFAQVGIQLALMHIGFLSIVLLLLGDLDASPGVLPMLIVAGPLLLTYAGIVLARPVFAARRWIQQNKAREIARCNDRVEELLGEWENPASGATPANDRPPMADVVAYRGMITAIPEWPFNAPATARLALYAVLPLGSWLAGAVVERAVDSLLR